MPPDRQAAARHSGELQRRLRNRRAAGSGRAAGVRPVRDRTGSPAHHAQFVGRVPSDAVGSHPAVGALRHMPHAAHAGARAERRRHRTAARAGAVPGVAAQRFQEHAELPAVPHAGGERAGADHTLRFLGSQAAHLSIESVRTDGDRLLAEVLVENLGGHKLPTGYPSRRAWLHVVVRDGSGRPVFESGAVKPDGSIQGNDNDADATKFEPHYTEIRRADEVQIYESVLGDPNNGVTTGLLTAVTYLKDNRLLPRGFDKRTAEPD